MEIRRTDDLGALIKEYRSRGGLTQAELASRLQVSTRWLSHFENGKATAQIGLVIRALNELGYRLTVEPFEAATSPAKTNRSKDRRKFSIDEIVDG
jgi:HTH-type transcriptional regulator / antitoxin HipB